LTSSYNFTSVKLFLN